ncbi:uncharacterized protein LOC111695330 [Eurytemora carolleeae]|uniref:uncharacterized protein LOC111695330 n=1 Tax=Eurytemora carolleeae TaxID=1294199 RepID=UPI000C78084A|nr:uncharacterized protein LOC111695330 [Eurytemora carolleeae]|eukprot:XP_023320382.1 uncharacterized protein LOC111695330 [Eurytemora affinis]
MLISLSTTKTVFLIFILLKTGEGIDEDGVGREGGGGGGGGIPPVCPPVGEEGICVCENYHLLWEEDNLCYREFSRGPCLEGHRLVYEPSLGAAECSCPVFWAKYEDGKCYQEYSQGPCELGTIVMADKEEGFCSCNRNLTMYYYEPDNKCYEHYSRGPCPLGHVLSFNYTTLKPECRCEGNFNFNPEDGACYELNTVGPCQQMENCQGTPCYMKGTDTALTECRCLPLNSLTESGKCFEPFTRGPCEFGEWFVWNRKEGGRCEEKKYCKRFDNWHWWSPHQRCYRQYTQGPCNKGSLFYLDAEKEGPGCHCRKEWDAYYWKETGECFEQESRGPCQEGQYFGYNTTTREAECNCFKSHVQNGSGACIELYTQGFCPEGTIVITNNQTGLLDCDCGPHLRDYYWPETGLCYPHFGQGPCKPGEQFRLHPRDHTPACILWGGPQILTN